MASITKEEHDTAIAKASADATAAANARFSAVLASEEYAGREPLAQKLLGNANLSADDIIDTLKAAEKKPVQEAADASSAAAGAEEAARQEMQAELARNKNSNVDANASGEGVGGATDASALWGQAIEANNPGVKVVCPATAYDAKGLMKSAIRDNDPVFVMENTLLYGETWEVPDEEYLIPLGVADVKREGTDVSLIAHGRAVITSLKAAEVLADEHGINAEVVDLRSIRPLDEEAILSSVRKTHRAVLVDENKPFCAVSAQIASMIQEKAFDDLDTPVLRVCSLDAPAIYSPPLEKLQLPTVERIVEKVLSIR